MLVLSDIPFKKGSFTCILYYILVEGKYSRTKVSHKSFYDERKLSYFENWCNFQYLLERTAVSIRIYKINILFEIHYSKDNLGDQINKNNCKNILQHVFQFTRALVIYLKNLFWDDLTVKCNGSLMFKLDVAQ